MYSQQPFAVYGDPLVAQIVLRPFFSAASADYI
jgi:hypothetical protein